MMPLLLQLLRLQSLVSLIAVSLLLSSSSEEAPIAMPGCIDQCGNVKIPYPFGITDNCFYNASYEIVCRNNATPILQHYRLEVIQINLPKAASLDDFIRNSPEGTFGNFDQNIIVRTPVRNICTNDGVRVQGLHFDGSPYSLSIWNDFMAVGCGGSALLTNRRGDMLAGCASVCANKASDIADIETTTCFGVGCCRSPIEFGVGGPLFYDAAVDHTIATSYKTCTLAAGLIKRHSVEKIAHLTTFPTVLEWSIANLTDYFLIKKLSDIRVNEVVYANFSCYRSFKGGIICMCSYRYEGNPYLPNGCQVVQECRKCKLHLCNDRDGHYYCENPLLQLGSILGFSISVGSALLLLCCYWLYKVMKRKREARRKAKYFKRNGGLLLQQRMSASDGALGETKIFRVTELAKATDNFNKNRILGQGGQGTVYKGMLTTGKIVAIKKSKQVDEGQLEHFINELVIISQINHRNVVKLLGCCLETKVPLLVYEYIPNGTLYQLLHAPSDDFHVTWKMRLQIAAESAGALAYLHSSSGTPIYHRDIKCSNILLDEKYRAKVSDFGTSRAITIEQTHVTTCVMGTYGYLDPEYFISNQFTEKSDVYSFGVVLVELITGRKPICPTKSGGWISLAYEFLFHMETSGLFDILDARVLEEGKKEEFIAVANLARQCLHMSGKQRPSMKEIAVVLDGIRSNKVPNLKEVRYEKMKCVVTEMSDVHRAPSRASTFCYDNCTGSSSSIDVQPLVHNTF